MSQEPDVANAVNTQTTEIDEEQPESRSPWHMRYAELQARPNNPEGWAELVRLAEIPNDDGVVDMERIKTTYEALLVAYPNTASAQIAYLDHAINLGQTGLVEKLFKRFLPSSPEVTLWRHYLAYVRRAHPSNDAVARQVLTDSYEYALKHIGQDKDSADLWADYIRFLRAANPSTPREEQEKNDALRKAYHRAVKIPLDNVENLWTELEAFETALNRTTAQKFMADLRPEHMQARTVLRQLRGHLAPLFPPAPPGKLWLPDIPTFDPAQRQQVGFWKAYLKWEESNPLQLEDKDKPTLEARIRGVYRKAVIRMRYFGEIWFMAYTWTKSIGKQDEATAILEAGIKANPSSFVLNFAYAELMESKGAFEKVHSTYKAFLQLLRCDLDQLQSHIDAVPGPNESTQDTTFNTQSTQDDETKRKDLAERRTEYGIVYIDYMRFARRAEDEKAFRAVFKNARQDSWTPWQVFEASALMEYHCGHNIEVARNIFTKGGEKFGEEVDFVLRHLIFLISINDRQNAHALFNEAKRKIPREKARPLWERWAQHVYQFDDLMTAHNLEKEFAEAYPADPPIKRFAQRHTYRGTDAIALRDLGVAVARHGSSQGSQQGSQRMDTSLRDHSSANISAQNTSLASHKRGPSPASSRRDEPPKRARASPPPPPRHAYRDDDFRREPPPRRRHSPAGWERDRDRDRERHDGPRYPPRRMEREQEEEKPVILKDIIPWFIGQLPSAQAFDGPVFKTDDLMNLFKNAIIPSSTGPPPLPPRMQAEAPRRGRPPPDYGPYQGPAAGGRRW